MSYQKNHYSVIFFSFQRPVKWESIQGSCCCFILVLCCGVLGNVIAGGVTLSFLLCFSFALALLANGVLFVAERLSFWSRFYWASVAFCLTSGYFFDCSRRRKACWMLLWRGTLRALQRATRHWIWWTNKYQRECPSVLCFSCMQFLLALPCLVCLLLFFPTQPAENIQTTYCTAQHYWW